MSRPIDFYFDFSSPYGYFAAMRIEPLAARYGRTVKWRPILLGIVFKTTGATPLPMVPLKGAYSMRDMQRTARFYGIPYQQPQPFPLATQLAARAMLWVMQTEGEPRAKSFAQAVYHAYFVDGKDISQPDAIAAVASGMDLDATALLEGANSSAIKDQLKSDMEAAIARGVFGSPFIVIDDEPFWGTDRFDQIEAYLQNGTI